MTLNKGSLVAENRKFFVTIESAAESLEVPVYAVSLEEALEEAELKYIQHGFAVTRVRPSTVLSS